MAINKNRIASIDVLRVLAIFAVISIHVDSYYDFEELGFPEPAEAFFSFLGRLRYLAVPTFFMISGYFFGKSSQREGDLGKTYWKTFSRLLWIFGAWTIIYAFPPLVADKDWNSIHQYGWLRTYYWNIQYELPYFIQFCMQEPLRLLLTGGTWHLWFIMSLALSLSLIFLFVNLKQEKILFFLAPFLYCIAPVVNLYVTPAPPNGYLWNPELGIFMSTFPVVTGWWLAKQKNYSYRMALAFLGGGIALSLIGRSFVDHFYHVYSTYGNFDIQLISAGIVILALRHPGFGSNTFLPAIGPFTLGVYCLHMIALDSLWNLNGSIDPSWWRLLLIFIVYAVSLGVTLLLKAIPVLRRLVM